MVWTGIGAVGAFIVGVVVLGEALTPMRIVAAALIVVLVMGNAISRAAQRRVYDERAD
jgi:multidrug transporter EmrE-like cation transporter